MGGAVGEKEGLKSWKCNAHLWDSQKKNVIAITTNHIS